MARRSRVRALFSAALAQVNGIFASTKWPVHGKSRGQSVKWAHGACRPSYLVEPLEKRQLLSFSAGLAAAPSVNEGSQWTVNLVTTGNETLSSWTVTWGDGTPNTVVPGTQLSATHTYADGPNAYTPTASVTTNIRTYPGIGLSLDPTFGPSANGKAAYHFSAGNDFGYAMKVQSDGKILVAGVYNGVDFALTRYNSDGSLDPGFGVNGKVSTDFSAGIDFAYALGIQSDGKIVLAGSATVSGTLDFALARYNTNGSLDDGSVNDLNPADHFGTVAGSYGKVTTSFFSSVPDVALSLAIQPADNKIVAAGYTFTGGNPTFAVARFSADGALDTTFDTDGKQIVDFANARETAQAVVVQPSDGRILLGGWMCGTGTSSQYDFALARLTTAGAVDSTFGSGGKVTTDFGPPSSGTNFLDSDYSLVIQPDNKIIAAGDTYNTVNNDFAIARYNVNGTLDTTFGSTGNGKVTTDFNNTNNTGFAVALQGTNILVAGVSTSPSSNATGTDFALARYTASGTLDTTFGTNGKLTTDINAGNDYGRAVAVLSDGRILAAGYAGNSFGLVRYQQTNQVTVNNVVPGIEIGGLPISSDEGEEVDLNAIVTDLNLFDAPYAYVWNVTRNAVIYATGNTADFSFTPDNEGTYVVTLSVTDKDGGTSQLSASIAINNVAPSASILGIPADVREGTPIDLNAYALDLGLLDVLSYAWNVAKNGSPFASGTSSDISFTPDDDAVYTVDLVVTDNAGATGTDTQTINVTNVAPRLRIAGLGSAVEGNNYSLSLFSSDPGMDTRSSWSVSWGDGNSSNVSGGASSTPHVFQFGQWHYITAIATDEDGSYDAANPVNVGVIPRAPTNIHATVSTDPADPRPSEIDLTWTDQSVLENGFTLEISKDNVIFDPLAIIGSDETQYAATGLIPSTTYYFRLTAYNDAGRSSSVTASATTPPVISDSVPDNDDSYFSPVDIGFPINFFGNLYTVTHVNNNGNLTFDGPSGTYSPIAPLSNGYGPIIAPFFADVDTNNSGGTVTFGPTTVSGHHAFRTIWNDVGYYSQHTDKRDTFSVTLVDRSDVSTADFDIIFNYTAINWDTGDASGGRNGFVDPDYLPDGAYPARAGYSAGTGKTGTFYERPGSGTDHGLIGLTGTFTYPIRNDRIDLQIIGVPETGASAHRGYVPVNNDVDESNHDAIGNLIPDNLPDAVVGDRITAADNEHRTATLYLLSPVSGVWLPGKWSLSFPSNIKVWKQETNGTFTKINSGELSTELISPQNIQLRIEGISPSSTLNDAQITASFSVTGTTHPITDTAWLTVVEPDADVDSDNNNLLSSPDGNAIEDGVEDIAGVDAHPGKVILVNDGDLDHDGIADYFDGFGANRYSDLSDESLNVHFAPMQVQLSGLDWRNGRIRITYAGSDPALVTSTLDDPYVLPAAGSLRIWIKDGDQPRDPHTVAQGGDYLAPGIYTLAQLGIPYNQPFTFYIEAVRQSASVADLPISVEIDPTGVAGYLAKDQVRVTASRAEVWATNYGDPTSFLTDRLVISDLSSTPSSNYDFTAAGYQSYHIRIYDPRTTGLSQFFIDNQSLSLQRIGNYYETPEFICVGLGDPITWSVPYQLIIISGDSVQFRYNPIWPFSSGPKVVKADAHRNQLADAIKRAVADMENRGWTGGNSDGDFGVQVHKQVSADLTHQSNRWVADIYVNNDTNQIVSIGARPPNGNVGTTQIDLVYLKQGENLNVNDVFNPTKVADLVEIKTSIGGRINPGQLKRLKTVMNEGEILVTNGTSRKWTKSNGWHTNAKFKNAFRILSLLGAASAVWNIIQSDSFDEELNKIVRRAKWISERDYSQHGGPDDKATDMIDLQIRMTNYAKHFCPDDTVLNFMQIGSIYKILGDLDFNDN
jgi:uncharacterized delta-60 repeat protein